MPQVNGSAWAMAAALLMLTSPPFASAVVWNGAGTNNIASNGDNWEGGTAPVAGNPVILDSRTNKSMTWNLNIEVGSWVQDGYLGTVTVQTIYGVSGFTNLAILGDCIISNGVWTHDVNAGTEVNRLSAWIGGSLVVGSNAEINATGKGYAHASGPGFNNNAGSYGGKQASSSGGPCYGSIVAPTNLGSGGWTVAGGGAILLVVSGEIRNDGLICADGVVPGNAAWGAAGGAVNLTAGTLTGSGTIRASSNKDNVGPGGGGRISLVVTNAGADLSLYTGPVLAFGGSYYGVDRGGAGTVYLRTAAQGRNMGTLIIDNNNLNGPSSTEINATMTDPTVGNVILRNAACLTLLSNQTLTVSGIWSNGANFVGKTNSQVVFLGGASSTSTVHGSTTFIGLTCTNGGKTLQFEAGKTNTVPAYGALTLKGAGGTNLILRSTVDGACWNLNVNALANQNVSHVSVQDSDALAGGAGAPITALTSVNSGGNSNWLFVTGGTNLWTGGSNTAWSLSTNWSLGRVPVADDFVRIPSSRPRYPALGQATTVNGIEIQSGASLSLSGHNLAVTTNAVVAGSLLASGTETVTFLANADFTGGAFTAERSTVLLAGNGSQSLNPDNLTFYRMYVANTNTVAFSSGLTATEFRCEAASGTRNIVFEQGATAMVRDLVLLGSAASTNIFLRSSSTGQKWNLAVSGYRSVRGVDVADSDASGGLLITAISSKNSGGNVNWLFDATQSVWLGTNGVNFHNPANWSPAAVPGANSRVLVESANPMAITGAVTLLDLTVGGGAGATSVTGNAPMTVVENIQVLTNGTLTLNRPCVVSNGLYVLAGGMLTHSINTSTEANKLSLTVLGNVGVDMNGAVDVTGKGYAHASGPGFNNNAGSYGGKQASSAGGPCYGSIVAPTNLGSGGWTVAGGGAILLTVSGEIRNDGLICADGVVPGNAAWGAAGGTVNLTAGTLTGSGTIRASSNKDNVGPGGGGRIALVVMNAGADLSLYTGPVLAFGGDYYAGIVGGAGTIYRQCANDLAGRGTVLLNNSISGYTDMPPGLPGCVPSEVDFAPFHVTNSARLRLTNDFIVGDIYVSSAAAWLDLGFRTLTVHSREHPLGPGTVTNYGAIIWAPIRNGTVFAVH